MTAPRTETMRHAVTGAPAPGGNYTKRKRMELLLTGLKNVRSSFDGHWKSINKVLFPTRGRFSMSDDNRGDRRNTAIIDSTATIAARTAAAGLMSGTSNPASEWFRFTTQDPVLADKPAVKDYLHQCVSIIRASLLRSNFYDVMQSVFGDLLVYGTGAWAVEEDDEDDLRFEHFPLGTYYVANDKKRRARTFVREYPLTTRQLVTLFGWKKVSSSVRQAWESGNLEQTWPVVHVIGSNEEYDPSKLKAKYKPFASCYFEAAQNEPEQLLRESGYDEFPVMVVRWDITGGDAYATDCPGMTALGDINQLQLGEKKSLQAIEKWVSPPLVGHPDLKREPVTQLPGGVTYDAMMGQTHGGLRPLHDVKPDVDKIELKQAQVRARIDKAFFADVFLMTSYLTEIAGKQPRTAAEIAVREQEKLMVLGPVLHRIDRDGFDPNLERVFNILNRRGRLPVPPPELEGADLKVEYISILHAAQKAKGIGQMERFLLFARTLAETAAADETGALLKLDTDQMLDEVHEMSGVPPRVVRSDDDVASIRAERQRAQDAAASAATMKDAASAAKQLSETDTQGENALTDLMSGAAAGTVPGGAE